MIHYILKGKLPVPADLLEWAVWFETAERHVGSTELEYGFWVSTVFLGLDHSFGRKEPLLFETMVFQNDTGNEVSIQNAEGEHMLLFDRYSNWNDAEKGHARIVARMQAWITRLTDHKIRPTWAVLQTSQGDTEV